MSPITVREHKKSTAQDFLTKALWSRKYTWFVLIITSLSATQSHRIDNNATKTVRPIDIY